MSQQREASPRGEETPDRPDDDSPEPGAVTDTTGSVNGADSDTYAGLRQDIAPLLESDNFVLEEQYWLEEYHSAAAILTNTNTGEQLYHVLEPDLTEDEHILYKKIEDRIREKLVLRESVHDEDSLRSVLRDRTEEIVEQLQDSPTRESIEKVAYFLQRDLVGHGRIQPLMHDPKLEEISCNGPGDKPLFVYHQEYYNIETNIRFDAGELRPYVRKLAQRSGKDISTANPTQGTTLPDGSRIQLTLEEISPEGETFTIRKFRDEPFTPVDLIKYGTFSTEQLAYLWYLVENEVSGLVAGGTGAGKTTSVNAMALFIEPGNKVITIEDTREVKIPQKNYVSTLTREGFTAAGDGDIDMFDLLRSSLRMRPEYLLVGEVRGAEAQNLFQAMNTGHTSLSTLHADSMQTVLSRLQSDPMNISKSLISELGVVTIQSQTEVDDDEVRRCQGIYEVGAHETDTDELHYRPIYKWNPKTDTMEKPSDSELLKTFREEGRSPDAAIKNREQVLEYLVENDITGYQPVTSIIRAFMRAPQAVLDQVESEYIDLEELAALENQTMYEANSDVEQ